MEIADVAHQLYGLPPEEFTAARNACAKAAKDGGDRELAASVTALRKPTAGAWLLNQLVRRHRGEVDGVLELGVRLRAAQGTLGAADLRALDEQRRQLTRAVARQAVAIAVAAGRKVSAQVTADVEETLRSAMVDPEAGAALATGLLTDTFSSNGLEPVEVARMVALGERATGPAAPVPRRAATVSDAAAHARAARALADAEHAVEAAQEHLRHAREESEQARQAAVEARRRREEVESQLAEVRRRLADLETQLAASSQAEDAARRTQVSATSAERAAVESANRARHELTTLLDRQVP
ncbi:MAG TPA: hypothetical protein PLS68_12865 [Actinotalea sp.]|nr:hypothetical protein [Actinotalea sp.]